ncbi:MAG: hypothetical protein M3331_00060 [Actinomycetota bacterium]|nr:hypothetical protein [Actinomycetota bacterium]
MLLLVLDRPPPSGVKAAGVGALIGVCMLVRPTSFFWNGLSRFWDIRRPSLALSETDFDGRSEAVTIAGLAAYYVLLPLALLGLWRLRGRRELLLPILALALAASLVFTIQAGTRYRAPSSPSSSSSLART